MRSYKNSYRGHRLATPLTALPFRTWVRAMYGDTPPAGHPRKIQAILRVKLA